MQIAYGDWVPKLVQNHVKGAFDSLELDARLAGSAATPGVQAIHDVTAYMEKKRVEDEAAPAQPLLKSHRWS